MLYVTIGSGFVHVLGLGLDGLPTSRNQLMVLIIAINVQVNDDVYIGSIKTITIGNNTLIAIKLCIAGGEHDLVNAYQS